MSSTMASAVSSTFAPIGACGAIKLSAPKANAMSVAIGMPQPCAPDPTQIENQIDQRRHNHSTNCARDWKRRLPGRGQLTSQQFPFDFEPDQEKKHGHQAVVDPIVQAQRKLVRRDRER